MKRTLTNKSWLIGLLGFLGFLGTSGPPAMYLFFAFFGGLQYYWWYKLGTEEDERLIENRNIAGTKAFRIAFCFGFLSSLVLSFLSLDYALLYRAELIILALTFALGTNLWAYLTYKYDAGE
ncbi:MULTISPECIES: DUF3796 domain-containing protein [Bacillaceae]|uniref:DUF3796 domain-containing protein n=1 Tax=Bacillaceae TaxID=186817 RepID=UPI000E7652FF|nr:DUF3796 domain-containing protein [Bacillus sp. PK3_68]RJS50092.1 hypothetical protein CJ483_22595 [Bacillus sp. PK3_68]